MKKGFTLVEVILSITLILVIGVSGFLMFKADKKEKTLEKMKKDIYRAANVLIETDSETKEQLYNSKNGAIIPLKKLENEGLIDFNGLNIEDEYVLSMLGSTEESEKCSGTLYNIGSWTKATDDVIYICGSENLSPEVKDYIDDKIDEINGTSDVLKEAIINNAKKERGTTLGSSLDLNNIADTDTINTLSKIGDEYVFEGNNIDNYVNFNGMCWRATRIQADGSIKLLLQDKDSPCDVAGYDGSWSIGQGHFGYTQDEPKRGYYNADYLYGEDDTTYSMQNILRNWFDSKFSSVKSKLKNNSWTIEDVNSKLIVKDGSDIVASNVSFADAINNYVKSDIYRYGVFSENTTFNSYVATIRLEEHQPYMDVDVYTDSFFTLNILSHDNAACNVGAVLDNGSLCESMLSHCRCYQKRHIRPMIVLKDGVKISGGYGTQVMPFVVA